MALSVTLTDIQKEADGTVRIQFGNREKEFASLAALKAFVRDQLGRETVEAIYLALVISRQPALNNPAAVIGHTLTIDLSLANWGKIS